MAGRFRDPANARVLARKACSLRASLLFPLTMLMAAIVLLTTAVLLGSALAVVYLGSEGSSAAPWRIAALHGLSGLAGLACLVLVVRAPALPSSHGTASFGRMSAWLFALAALVGTAILRARWRRRRPGALIAVHATLAISAFVIFAAYAFVR